MRYGIRPLLCTVILVGLLCVAGNASAQPGLDRQALIELYNSTNGANWFNNTNWLSGEPISEWYGVTQSSAGDGEWVLGLDLRENNLTGPLPTGWPPLIGSGAFRDLETIILDDNNISGPIPPVLGQLPSLFILSINSNSLSGGLPSELSELTNLVFLSFYDNQLAGPIPESYYFLPNLQTLQLLFNQLTGELPSGLGGNNVMQNLRLGFNQLSGSIPSDIADGASMRAVALAGNDLSGSIPPEIGGSGILQELDLGGNQLVGSIPAELGNLPELTSLRLEDNQLTGDVPESFKDLSSLQLLQLTSNQLTGLPDLGGLVNLTNLQVANNFFEVNDLLPNANVSTFLYSPQNPFDAPQAIEIPVGGSTTLDASPDMDSENVYQWLLEGNAISQATNITYQITDAQPSQSGTYTLRVTHPALPELVLLSEDIVVTVGGTGQTADRDALMALYDATGGDNWTNNTNWGTTEPISEWFGVTESSGVPGAVATLDLRNNALQGGLPSEWTTMISNGALSELTSLDLSVNLLTGNLPAALGVLGNLRSLEFTLNFLQGAIPEELGSLSNLETLRLDDNAFQGDVPLALTSMSSLNYLNLGSNLLVSLPDFTSAPNLTILSVENNFLEFDDLEPNVGISSFLYSPQRVFGDGGSITISEGGSRTLSFSVGGTNNQYQWLRNSSPISGATSSNYQITNASAADEGVYQLSVTNPDVPDLTLLSSSLVVSLSTGGGTQSEFIVTNTNDSGAGSLRAAILDANANVNEQGFLDEILFDIPGAGPHVIRPSTPLPAIVESVVIDATTQPGASCGQTIADRDLRIVLDGTNTNGDGLVVRENLTTMIISGLVINNFNGAGILIEDAPLVSIQCNFIGTDVTGETSAPNVDGILARRSNNVLIGAGSGQTGNLISGNGGYGVLIDGQGQSGGSVLYGNLIGTDRTGTVAVPNSTGVLALNGSALIGAPGETESNVISGNSVRGVEVRGANSAGTFMTNNFIGTDVTGTLPLPNGEGILVHDGANSVIVGFFTDTNDEGFSNLIAFNDGPGVTVTGATSTGIRISANRMFENVGLGIDLGDDGLNLNDIGDGDEGPNGLINSPQIVSSTINGSGELVVSYLVESGGQARTIEFFAADADGEEGARYLGMDTYFLNESGQTVQFNLGSAAALGVTDPEAIVATSTDNFGNTSEFSGAGSGPGGGNEFVVTEPDDVIAVSGGSVPLQATVPSGFNATVREVCYRRTGEAEFTCAPMQTGGSGFEGSIPSSFVTARGVQYYFRFSDGSTDRTVPETDPEGNAYVLQVNVSNVRAEGSFSPNTYRMISIPLELSDGSFDSVLDEYGAANPNRWRLLRWEPTLEAYRAYPDLSGGFSPCAAYWLITFDGGDFEVENGMSVDPLEPCFVTVRPGWNQVGSPYAFPVAWTDVDVSGAVDGPVLYDASSGEEDPYVYDVEVLEPWLGYWVFNPGTQNVFMSFNPVEAVGKTAAAGKRVRDRHLAGDEFELRMRASMPALGLVDGRNHVGLSPRASDGFDDLDFAEAPPIGDHVRLSIIEDGRRVAGSFRSAGGDGQTWDLRVSADVDGAPAAGIVRVALDRFGHAPDGFELRLVDVDAGVPVRLDDDGFEVELTGSDPVRNLRLIFGTSSFTEEAGGAIAEVPGHAELAQNYPNPFNPSTRIRYQVHVEGDVEIAVIDPLGRKIRTLVDGYREPGWYDTVWNGRDESGAPVSSGIYFYVLTTTDGSDSRTMVLLR